MNVELLEEVVKEGEKINRYYKKPTVDELNKINDIVLEYIKDKGLTIYGGTTINELLKLKGNSIYDKDKIPDYDSLSLDNNRHSMELCNLLFEKKFQYIKRITAIHENTFSIIVDFSEKPNADLTYVPPNIFSVIDFVKIDGAYYVSPQYQFIDFYKSFTNINNYYRWKEKDEYERYLKLEKAYPSQKVELNIVPINSEKNEVQKNILSFLKEEEDVIFSGIYTYNKFNEYMKINQRLPYYVLDIYSDDAKKMANNIAGKLKVKVDIKHFHPFVDHYPESYSLYYKGEPILNIYDKRDIYVHSVKINNDTFVSYHYLLFFLYVQLLKMKLLKHTYGLDLTNYMIYHIQ